MIIQLPFHFNLIVAILKTLKSSAIFYSNRYQYHQTFKSTIVNSKEFCLTDFITLMENQLMSRTRNFHVKFCNFETNRENAANWKFIKIDFNKNDMKSNNFKLESKVLIALLPAAIVAITVMTIKKNQNDASSENFFNFFFI